MPDPVGEGAEGQPLGGVVGPVAADQLVPVEEVVEQLLQEMEAVGLAERVQAEARPGLRGALDDTGGALAAEPVGVAPDPAVLGLLEGEAEGVEHLGGAEPDVLVAAARDRAAEVVGVGLAERAVDAVRGDDQVRVGQFGCVGAGDVVLELDPYTELLGPVGEQGEHPPPPDPEARVAPVDGPLVADDGDPVVPGHGRVGDGGRGLGVARAQLVEQPGPVRHAPAVRGARGVPLVHGDLMGGVLPLQQDREIEAAWDRRRRSRASRALPREPSLDTVRLNSNAR